MPLSIISSAVPIAGGEEHLRNLHFPVEIVDESYDLFSAGHVARDEMWHRFEPCPPQLHRDLPHHVRRLVGKVSDEDLRTRGHPLYDCPARRLVARGDFEGVAIHEIRQHLGCP